MVSHSRVASGGPEGGSVQRRTGGGDVERRWRHNVMIQDEATEAYSRT